MTSAGARATPSPRTPQTPLQVVFAILAIAFVLYFVYQVRLVLLVLVFAVFFAYLLLPLVVRTERLLRRAGIPRRLSRGTSIAVVYVLLWIAATSAGLVLVPKLSQQITDMTAQTPRYVETLQHWAERWSAFEQARLPVEFHDRVDVWIARGSEAVIDYAQAAAFAVLTLLTFVPWAVLIPVLAFFLLKDVDEIRYYALYALPPSLRGPGYQIVQEINTAISSYVRAQLLACLIIAATCTAAFALLRVPYAALLGVAAGVLEFVPLIGPLIVAVVACLVAAVHAPVLALWVAVFLTVLRLLEDYVIYPRLMGHGTHLHPLTVILAVLMGAELGGVVGIFLAVPVAAMLSVGYRRWAAGRREVETLDRGLSTSAPVDAAGE